MDRREALKALVGIPLALNRLVGSEQQRPPIQAEVLYSHEINGTRFYNDVAARIEKGFTPVSLVDFYSALSESGKIPQNSFLITWDDGLLSQYTQGLPALSRLQEDYKIFVPVTLFAMTRFEGLPLSIKDIPDDTPSFNDNVHRYMTKAHIGEFLQLGHEVGNITVDHVNILGISGGYLEQEVQNAEKSINDMYELIGKERKVKAFAYPYGAVSQQRAEFIQNQGFDLGFSTQRTTVHSWQNRYTLGRIAS